VRPTRQYGASSVEPQFEPGVSILALRRARLHPSPVRLRSRNYISDGLLAASTLERVARDGQIAANSDYIAAKEWLIPVEDPGNPLTSAKRTTPPRALP
jgi:hypothetical protein